MKVIEYLKEYGPKKLEKELGIEIKYYNDRISLNYSIIDSPKYLHIVKECRGLILSLPNYRILCRSFNRFYNYLEDPSKNFDIKKAICTQKIDGTLINVYFDGNEWQVATRKMAFAEGTTRLGNTYKSIFEKACGGAVNNVFSGLNVDYTYTFEYVSPETRVVTPYTEPAIYILNIKHNETGIDSNEFKVNHTIDYLNTKQKTIIIKKPKTYAFNNINEIMSSLKDLPALDEGYVCYMKEKQWRIKIKNPSYLAVAHLKDNNGIISTKRIILLVCAQDYEEYLNHFPEDLSLFQPYIEAFSYMKNYVNALYQATKHIVNRKEFANAVKGPAQYLLFGIRDGKKLTEMIERMTDKAKERMIVGFVKKMGKCID